MRLSHKIVIILCMSGTALASPALAQDIHPAVQAVLDNIERQVKVKPTYDAIETDGDGNVTISKLMIEKAAEGDGPSLSMRVDEVVLSGIKDEGNGLYEISNGRFGNINADMSGKDMAVTVEVAEASAEGWFIKVAGDNPTALDEVRQSMNVARKMSTGAINMAVKGQKITVEGYEQTWDGDPSTGAGTYDSRITNIAVPEQTIAMIDQGGFLQQLGYGGLNIDVASNGKVDIVDDNFGFKFNMTMKAREMGAIDLGMSATQIPIAVYGELINAQKTGKEPDFSAMMPEIQGITLSNFAVRFEDMSITKKLLPMIAAMQGTDEATLVASAGPMLQLGLMQLQNQAFAEQTTAAVNGFLKDPKSLTVSANPASPLTVGEIMTMNPNAPGEIITKLGVSVSSND